MAPCTVIELRQYTLAPGQRDVLIELFDREFVEPQEAAGMHLLGQFRDLDRADRFVWLRGFSDMERRRLALEEFYGGAAWKAHSAAANATMIDSDDVLLLRPVAGSDHRVDVHEPRPRPGDQAPSSTYAVTICSLDGPVEADLLHQHVLPALDQGMAAALAIYVEEPSENTFPNLPVRSGEHVVVWIQRGDEVTLPAQADIARRLLPGLVADPVRLRLQPTPGSRLR